MDPGALSARRAVTAEYVKTRALIEEAETGYLPALPLSSALLLDKGHGSLTWMVLIVVQRAMS